MVNVKLQGVTSWIFQCTSCLPIENPETEISNNNDSDVHAKSYPVVKEGERGWNPSSPITLRCFEKFLRFKKGACYVFYKMTLILYDTYVNDAAGGQSSNIADFPSIFHCFHYNWNLTGKQK